ncbi:hypothetical protein E8E11_008935 [Didymella keratinophila]|nr:hypothetical protein E8E11_008935 [Didymella keratinophila]
MAPVKQIHQTQLSTANAASAGAYRVIKRPARGFHRFRSGILNVVPKGAERSIVNMNRNSALLRLPTEIRQEIWKYVLGGKTYQASCFSGRYYSESYRFAPFAAESRNGMALLRTCRQIYSEAVLYPFFEATFSYHNVTYLKRSVKTLHSYQLKQVTHLQIDCPGLHEDLPSLGPPTVVVHGITDADYGFDREPFVAKVENLPPRLRKTIESTGASLEVKSSHDSIASRDVDEMDDADADDDDDETGMVIGNCRMI